LTITQKNGKIYVSLEESLLFASGSFTIDPKGVEAIKKLAKVLETNTDINVLIEGHTDNVPYNGTGVIKITGPKCKKSNCNCENYYQ